MLNRGGVLLSVSMCLLLSSQARPAASQLETQLNGIRQTLSRLELAGKYKLTDLLRVRLERDQINVELLAPAKRTGTFRIEIEGSSAQWQMNFNRHAMGMGNVMEYFNLVRYDFDEAPKGGIWSTNLGARPNQLYLNAQAGVGGEMNMQISFVNGRVSVNIWDRRKNPQGQPLVQANNTTLNDVRSRFPREYRQYVTPMFRRMLGCDPTQLKPADAYRAFPQIAADPQAMAQLEALLPRMVSPVPSEREAASRELSALGTRGVLAAMRLDRSVLTPEESGRLDAFIAQHDDRRVTRAAESRKDIWFLIDCLEFEDIAVRQAALDQLAAILKSKPQFDVNASADARIAAADKLREIAGKLPAAPPEPPTTGPANKAPFIPRPVASD